MKALEKDRNRRYETASAFAADVQRYLHDEPVAACPPSAWYRFRKSARRRGLFRWRSRWLSACCSRGRQLRLAVRDQAAREASGGRADVESTAKCGRKKPSSGGRIAEKENKIRSLLGQATAQRLSREPGRVGGPSRRFARVALGPSRLGLRHELRNEAIARPAISLDRSPGRKDPACWRAPSASISTTNWNALPVSIAVENQCPTSWGTMRKSAGFLAKARKPGSALAQMGSFS